MKIPKFTKEDFDEMAKEYAKQEAKILKMCQDFWQSTRMRQIMEVLKKEVDKYGSVGDDLYGDPLPDVKNDEFMLLFECVFNKEIIDLPVTESGELFWQESVVYDGMEFVQIHGQGTAFIVKRLQ